MPQTHFAITFATFSTHPPLHGATTNLIQSLLLRN